MKRLTKRAGKQWSLYRFFKRAGAMAVGATCVLAVSAPAAENLQCGTFENEGTKFLEQTTQNGIEYSLKRTFDLPDYKLHCAEYVAAKGRKGATFCYDRKGLSLGIACSYDGSYDKSIKGAIKDIALINSLLRLATVVFILTVGTLGMHYIPRWFSRPGEGTGDTAARPPRPVFDGRFDTSPSAPREAKPTKPDSDDPSFHGEEDGIRKVAI